MSVKQLSAFVENKPGKVMDLLKLLSHDNINIRAMSIADTMDFGILRLIVSDTHKAKESLSHESLVTVTDVIAAKMNDEAGALYEILTVLKDANINIEYMYAFTASDESGAYVVMRVDNNEAAEKALHDDGIITLTEDSIKNI